MEASPPPPSPPPPPRPVTHVIFDMDGLLLDTERLYSAVFGEVCGRYGRRYDGAVKARTLGRTAPEAAAAVVRALSLPLSPQSLHRETHHRLQSLFPTANLMPGAERLVRHLREHGVPCGLATSSCSASFEAKTRRHRDFFSLFDPVVLGDDPEVLQGKPAPDIFLACARRFSPPPEPQACLVLEDAPLGLRAARAAGMQAVLVPEEPLSAELTAGATLVLPSLCHLRPQLFGLPALP
uniref:pseudouridine-5'-phosphatase-like n=1 Tax=Jaculus jaculus TaxID=51337 RepID=UPI001E1B4A6A|nr:pseudouridine-5'-phosphatase-like [Jaculus jaculus]